MKAVYFDQRVKYQKLTPKAGARNLFDQLNLEIT